MKITKQEYKYYYVKVMDFYGERIVQFVPKEIYYPEAEFQEKAKFLTLHDYVGNTERLNEILEAGKELKNLLKMYGKTT